MDGQPLDAAADTLTILMSLIVAILRTNRLIRTTAGPSVFSATTDGCRQSRCPCRRSLIGIDKVCVGGKVVGAEVGGAL